jgi:hypothetical protein
VINRQRLKARQRQREDYALEDDAPEECDARSERGVGSVGLSQESRYSRPKPAWVEA